MLKPNLEDVHDPEHTGGSGTGRRAPADSWRAADPPPKSLHKTLRKVDSKGDAAGSAYRAYLRYSHTNASLLAAGTTYYIFLAVFSILVFAFGLYSADRWPSPGGHGHRKRERGLPWTDR